MEIELRRIGIRCPCFRPFLPGSPPSGSSTVRLPSCSCCRCSFINPATHTPRPPPLILHFGTLARPVEAGDALERIRRNGRLLYGSDMEGGGPYGYPDPRSPRGVTGFEVELMDRLAKNLGVASEFAQGQWDKLLQVLDAGRIDVVCNGYEWTDTRALDYLATRPYYVYQLQLMTRRGGPIHSWADLKQPKPGGGRWNVGVLVASAADTFAVEHGSEHIEVVRFDGATDAMTAVQNGQYDATLQDLPAARFYRERFPGLELVGPPESHGYYVIYVRKDDGPLRNALDQGIESARRLG